MIAVDTNVLVGAIQTFDPQLHATARGAVKYLYRQGEQLLCFPQNLVEFWNVSTRPANANGLGFSPEQAARYVDRFQAFLIRRVLAATGGNKSKAAQILGIERKTLYRKLDRMKL